MRLMNPMIAVLTLGMTFAATDAALSQPHASGMSPERLERVTAVFDKDIADGAIAGIVSLIYRHGEIAHLRARGFQDVDARTPMRRDTIFGLASMTKPVTAVAVMMLVEEGALGLDEPVDHWLPKLADRKVLNDPAGPLDAVHDAPRPITVRDLLRYTMGLGRDRYGGHRPRRAHHCGLCGTAWRRSDRGGRVYETAGRAPTGGRTGRAFLVQHRLECGRRPHFARLGYGAGSVHGDKDLRTAWHERYGFLGAGTQARPPGHVLPRGAARRVHSFRSGTMTRDTRHRPSSRRAQAVWSLQWTTT